MMKKTTFSLVALALLILPSPSLAAISDSLKGQIILQVEEHGEAWYVHPETGKVFFLGRPADALNLMASLGLGISNKNLALLQGEGHKGSYNRNLSRQLAGKILLQVEDKGQAWYINPRDLKRYYLGSPEDALRVLKKLGVGISEKNFAMLTPSDAYKESRRRLQLAERAAQAGLQAITDAEVLGAISSGILVQLRGADMVAYKFALTSPLSTDTYGYLGRGEYYFSTKSGLMAKARFESSGELEALTAQMVLQQMLQIQTNLEAYRNDLGVYPLTDIQGVEIGTPGRTILTNEHGFFGMLDDEVVYMTLQLPAMSGHSYVYTSLENGNSYSLRFYLPAAVGNLAKGQHHLTSEGIFPI